MGKPVALFLLTAVIVSTAVSNELPRIGICEIYTNDWAHKTVELVGRVTATIGDTHLVLQDETGSCCASLDHRQDCVCGDTVVARTLIMHTASGSTGIFVRETEVLRHEPSDPIPLALGIGDLANPTNQYRVISTDGTVTSVFRDELDSTYAFMTLESDNGVAIIYFRDAEPDLAQYKRLVDREWTVTGVCRPLITGFRLNVEYPTVIVDPKSAFRPLKANSRHFPHRQTYRGTVLAPLGRHAFYLSTDNDERIKVYLNPNALLPTAGQRVSVAGFVRKNTFFKSLSNAILTVLPGQTVPAEEPTDTTPRELLYDAHGHREMKAGYVGRPIRIRGVVTGISEANTPDARLTLNSDGISTAVSIGATPPPPMGSEVRATGICLAETEADGNPVGFVRIKGFSLVTRNADDIVILRHPPWWTPLRFMLVITALAALVVAVLIWNKALRTLAERRGRELMDEQLGRVSADLKVSERTRLAVELHDALSQNLTGVSLQLDAVKRFADEDRGRMARHLDMAMRTLKSCRDELRNCLWDLRNRALEESDMNEAIRRTASPFLGDASLLIRFNVPRNQISDNTAHVLMRIIRELATNAVRHGAAKTIRIAGALENGHLFFSVSDDGGGFDPQRHPGVDEGHFGLDGIRERIENLGGSIEIESAPGKGSTIRISMTA